jgi:hypothetical protein
MTSGGKGSIMDLNNTTTSPIYAALNSFLPVDNPNQTSKPKAGNSLYKPYNARCDWSI